MEEAVRDRPRPSAGLVEAAARGLQRYHRLALIAGGIGLGAVIVLDVPGVANVRRYRSAAAVLSHLTFALIALGLSPRFPGWIARVAALSSRGRVLCLAGALLGPLTVMASVLAVAPSYGHELFTREWGLAEPLQFVLWLTAAWLAFERARYGGRGSAEDRAFRMAGVACIVLALEEVDYLGVVSLVARMAGVPDGRIRGHHIGGLHDLVNDLGKTSLVLGVLTLALVAALILAWAVSQGFHRVVGHEIWSVTALPLAGGVVFMAVAQLADIDHPALAALFGQFALVRRLREEPMELLAVICINAALLAKLTPYVQRQPASNPSAAGTMKISSPTA